MTEKNNQGDVRVRRADGERSRNGDDDRMAGDGGGTRECVSGNRTNENLGRQFDTGCLVVNGSLTAPRRTSTPPPEMPLYVHILIHLLYSTF